jgi:hypothetical protein
MLPAATLTKLANLVVDSICLEWVQHRRFGQPRASLAVSFASGRINYRVQWVKAVELEE